MMIAGDGAHRGRGGCRAARSDVSVATCRWRRSRRTASAVGPRCSSRSRRSTTSIASPAATAATGLPVLVDRSWLQHARRRLGVSGHRGVARRVRGRHRDRCGRRRRTSRRHRGRRCRPAGARPPDRGRVGHRVRVGGRRSGIGRRRGTDERRRTRLRHGGVRSIDVDVFDLGDDAATAVLRRIDAGDLGLRFRGSDLDRRPARGRGPARPRVAAIARRPSARSPRSCAGAVSTSRVGRTADRCSSTRCPAR